VTTQAGRLFWAALLTALVLVSAAGATHSPWPDAKHGWELRGDVDSGGLYSTEDGGRHWHLIYPARGSDIMGFLRTSANAGAISIDYKAPEQYWTRDNGRHWHFTRRLPAFWAGGMDLAGQGRLLYWSRGHVVYQVRNWPPEPGAALRLRLLHRVADGRFMDLAWIPGGAVGVIFREPGSPTTPLARVFLRRFRGTYVIRLQDPGPARAGLVRRLRIYASWPELTVLGEGEFGDPLVTWASEDGGRTWRISGRT
jgi:hypothetical protein